MNYQSLNSTITPIKKGSEDYKLISKFIADGGNSYKMVDCFSIARNGEDKTFNPKKIGNKMLLWHGSRFSNYAGIIRQGLRIAPPEAPHNGYLSGKGIYFATNIDLSYGYGCPGLSNGVGIYVLAEVAVGKSGDCDGYSTTEKSQLAKGFNSTEWRDEKNLKFKTKVFGDVSVPFGSSSGQAYIVYNVNQVKLRYLVRIKDE